MSRAENWIPTRQSLLSRLREWDDAASWQDFFDTYSELLFRVARKSGLSDAEAQDAVQETVIAVAKKLPEFRYDRRKGSFKGWLLRTLQWRISDQFRKRRPDVPLEALAEGATPVEDLAEPAVQAAAHWDRLWEAHLWQLALQRVRQQSDPRDFQMFDLVVRQEWPAARVAEKLQVSRARVYYIKSKLAGQVQQAVKTLESEWGAE